MITLTEIMDTTKFVVSKCAVELRNPATFVEIKCEIATLLMHSRAIAAALFGLIILDLDILIMFVSWAYVILIARSISKVDTAAFEKLDKKLYLCKLIWIKMTSLVVSFILSKLAMELTMSLMWLVNDPPNYALSIVFNVTTKWLAFVQYFTFYQFYLYIWMAFGSYVNPLMQRKLTTNLLGADCSEAEPTEEASGESEHVEEQNVKQKTE